MTGSGWAIPPDLRAGAAASYLHGRLRTVRAAHSGSIRVQQRYGPWEEGRRLRAEQRREVAWLTGAIRVLKTGYFASPRRRT